LHNKPLPNMDLLICAKTCVIYRPHKIWIYLTWATSLKQLNPLLPNTVTLYFHLLYVGPLFHNAHDFGCSFNIH
jgi:hypothetical protein